MSERVKIGVWVEKGKVYRRSDEKEVSLTIYTPKNPEGIEAVASLARQLHFESTMPHWTAQTEAQHAETTKRMKELASIGS